MDDVWGTTWTAAEINAATFGIYFAVGNNHNKQSSTASVDFIRVTVYYTPLPPTYDLTMAADPAEGGTATDLTAESPYAEETEVEIKAEAADGYRFVNWTAPAGTLDDDEAAEATFTMPGEDVTVTAHFIKQYDLTVDSTEGGLVTNPGEDTFTYDEGTVVDLVAEAEEGYRFDEWTGDVDTIADLSLIHISEPTRPY